MAKIRVFGLDLTTSGSTILAPTLKHVDPKHWKATITGTGTKSANIDALLHVAAPGSVDYKSTVHFSLTIKLVDDGHGILVPAPGSHPQSNTQFFRLRTGTPDDTNGETIEFEIDSVSLLSGVVQLSGKNGDLSFRLDKNVPVGSDRLPLRVSTGTGGLQLDLSKSRLSLDSAFFEAEVFAKFDVGLSPFEFLPRIHRSLQAFYDLGAPALRREISFEPASKSGPLPLHVDRRDRADVSERNPIFSALGATGYQLTVGLAKSDGDTPTVDRVLLGPAAGSFKLITFAMADRLNASLVWNVQSPMELAVRRRTAERPSSLLIAGRYARSSTDLQPIKMDRIGTGPAHGLLPEAEFQLDDTVKLFCERSIPASDDPIDQLASSLDFDDSFPWIASSGASRLVKAKPGRAYIDKASVISRLDFAGAGSAYPLVPDRMLTDDGKTKKDFYDDINSHFQTQTHKLQLARHEALMAESPVSGEEILKLSRVFAPATGKDDNTFRTKPHAVIRDYGPIKLQLLLDENENPDYAIVWPGDSNRKFVDSDFTFRPDPGRPEFALKDGPQGRNGQPLAIAKLSNRFSLEQIIKDEKLPFPAAILDETIRDRAEWIGLVLLDVPVEFEKFITLKALVSKLAFSYVAITPRKDSTGGFSITACIDWVNKESDAQPARPNDDLETTFRTNNIQVAWRDSRLIYFHTETVVKFPYSFSLKFHDSSIPLINIFGSYDEKSKTIRFLGQFNREVPIFDPANAADGAFGPIRQVYIKSAEIIETQGVSSISLDGEIELRLVEFLGEKWVDTDKNRRVQFKGLGLKLTKNLGDNKPRWLSFSYPSIKLNLDLPHFRLFGIEALQLKIRSIGVDWSNRFEWNALVPIVKKTIAGPTFMLDVRLDMMNLPALAAKSVKQFMFEFTLGLGPIDGKWDSGNFRVGLAAVGFQGLDLDLMRFLEVHADDVKLRVRNLTTTGENIPSFDLIGASVRILGVPIVKNLIASFFAMRDGQKGFLAYVDKPFSYGILDVEWVIIGQNIRIEEAFALDIMAIDTPEQGGHAEFLKKIKAAVDNESILPLPKSGGRAIGEWLFAAGFNILKDFLVGKFLFQDKAYYGVALRGSIFEEWFGIKLAISVLYIQRNRPEEDSFVVSFQIPSFTVGTIMFTGGVTSIEIAMNGGFTLDVGFPWLLPDGTRRWERTLGAIVTPFQGSGGFYLSKRTSTIGDKNLLRLAGGYGVQGGLGAAFGGGIFTVWVRAGITVVLEGAFAFRKTELLGLRISGAVGILVQGHGEINWWIISVGVDIIAGAEARATLIWGEDPGAAFLPDGRFDPALLEASYEDDGKQLVRADARSSMELQLDFILYARASARACLGSGPFKICKSIGVSVTMPFHTTIQIGQ